MVLKLYLTLNKIIKFYKMELKFGVPNLRNKKEVKEEKYSTTGVLTFLPTAEKLGRKMELNTFAKELLNLTDTNNQISFSFTGNDIYIVNTSGLEGVSGLKINKSNTFTDKKQYEFIKNKLYNLKDEDTLELFFEQTNNEFNNNKVYKLVYQVIDKEMESASLEDFKEEYTTEEINMLESDNLAKEMEVSSAEQLYSDRF